MRFIGLIPQDQYSDSITRPELIKILDFLKQNNDSKKTPKLIEYIESVENSMSKNSSADMIKKVYNL